MPGRALWRLIADPSADPMSASPEELRDAAQAFAILSSPALAKHLLHDAERRLDTVLIDVDAARQSRLMGRFHRARQISVAQTFARAGIGSVFLKGFANAHVYYPDPDLRIVGDLDILVRRTDLPAAVDLLERADFNCVALPTRRWGFISDASFMPFVAADGQCNVDLHVEPDSYPVHRSLNAARVFAESRHAAADRFDIRVPRHEHALILCAANAAKDKFGPFSVRKIVDAMVILRSGARLDWREIEVLARKGRYRRPLSAFLTLLAELGVPRARMPGRLLMTGDDAARRELDIVRDDFLDFFRDTPTLMRTWRREMLLCADPSVGVRLALRRLRGFVRPASGVLRGASNG